MASLKDYERKRTRGKTPEPFEQGAEAGKAPIFVIQRHDARRLHYDFRLERDGALASWAVPKGVPLEPGTQHLAVHVEDHPLSYGSFEGEIPAGNYGAGTVEIWDRGTYELVEEKPNGGLTVHLHGERLEGLWTLVPAKLGGDPKNWLLVKKKEEDAPAAKRRSYAPMLATLAADVPTGEGWLFEVKWDGFRAIATIRGGDVDLRSRNDKSFVERFPTVVRTLERALRTPDCVLDGEVVAVGEDGRATFSAMQQGKEGTTYLYVAFDLLEVEGTPLIDLPLTERRKRLAEIVDTRQRGIQISDTFDDGRALYKAAQEQRFEGIMAKRADSRYEPGRRSRNWLKIKTQGRQELVIAGYTKGQGRRAGVVRRARPRRLRERRPPLGGERRHGLRRRRDRASARAPEAAAARRLSLRRGAEDAEGAEGRRRLGRARARRRGPLRRVDARRQAAGAGVPGAARGQGGG